MDNNGQCPFVTCLCPTYGRFSMLRESLACFIAQDYPNKKLLILNDADEGLYLDGAVAMRFVLVVNRSERFENLGEKRRALLEAADTPLVAHWDDDDLYLPWHLSDAVARLSDGVPCTKVRRSWLMKKGEIVGTHDAGNDGSMVFNREAALDLGGYARKQVGQSIDLLHRFLKADLCAPMAQGEMFSVVVRRDAYTNVCLRSVQAFRGRNQDFGDGGPLRPVDLWHLWQAVIEGTRGRMSTERHGELIRRLETTCG